MAQDMAMSLPTRWYQFKSKSQQNQLGALVLVLRRPEISSGTSYLSNGCAECTGVHLEFTTSRQMVKVIAPIHFSRFDNTSF